MWKKFIFITTFSFIMVSGIAQDVINNNSKTFKSGNSPYLMRSTLGVNGLSKTISTNTETYFFCQSIGQASVIGTFKNKNYIIRQGFLQPINRLIKNKSALENDSKNKLKAVIYPNPFQNKVNVSFDEFITDELLVVVYNSSGSILFWKKYPASQQINLSLGYLPQGDHILKITTSNKQFVAKIIKQ